MRISLITVCLNSEKTIAYTLYSVFHQSYKNIEHIFVDGGSSDNTLNIIKKHKIKKKIIKENNLGIYDSINLGIKNCSGQYVLILHSDDILDNKYTIEKAVNKIKNKKKDIYFGNISYFDGNKFNKIKRFFSAKNFKLWHLIFGVMPPHTGCFIKSSIAKKYPYNPNFLIAGDYDFLLRVLKIYKRSYEKIDLLITRMRTGGTSGKNILTHFISSLEIFKSRKINKEISSLILIYLRVFFKLKQFFFFKKSITFKIDNYYEKLLHYDIKIIQNLKKLKFNINFSLSALNIAFIGSYLANEIKVFKNFFCWPDGIFVKRIDKTLRKIPGRDLLKKIIIPEKIKITVIGNLNDVSKKFLERNYKRKIFHKDANYGSIKSIIKKFTYKISKNELIYITLPTPKQEQLAEYLVSINKFYKIICIGGSINIASGVEKKVPNFLKNYEFIWRLRTDTMRRSKRLFASFFKYIFGKFFSKKFANLSYKIIN